MPPSEPSAQAEFDSLARSLLPSTGRLTSAIQFARAIAGKAAIFLPFFGGKAGLIAKAHDAYDQYCAPYDIPGLKDDTEKAIDAAAKLVIRDLIDEAAAAIG
jgi:hypothetical protein